MILMNLMRELKINVLQQEEFSSLSSKYNSQKIIDESYEK